MLVWWFACLVCCATSFVCCVLGLTLVGLVDVIAACLVLVYMINYFVCFVLGWLICLFVVIFCFDCCTVCLRLTCGFIWFC